MAQTFAIQLNGIVSDDVSNTRRNLFGGYVGWRADVSVAYNTYSVSSTSISVGNATQGLFVSSDIPVDLTFTLNGTVVTFPQQTLLSVSGNITNIQVVNSVSGSDPSTTKIVLIS